MTAKTPPDPELHKVRLVSQPHLGEIEVGPEELRDLLTQGLVARPTRALQDAAAQAGPNPPDTDNADTAKKES